VLAIDSPRWGHSFALVLLVHTALLSAQWWLSSRQLPPDKGDIQAVMVELVPLPTAPLAPLSELPPGPPQQVQQAQPKSALKAPAPKFEPAPELVPEVEDSYLPVEKEEVSAKLTQEQVTIAQTTAPPSMDAALGENYAGNQTVYGQARQQALASWQGLLLGHLKKHRRYPRQAQRARLQGVSQIRFFVDRQGRVSNRLVAESSGHLILDEEALATLLRASPVPPPPPEIRGNPVEVVIPVSFFIRRR